MFNPFKKQTRQGKEITFNIKGMHCPSCAMNIDGKLEEIKGVLSAATSYNQAKTRIVYNPSIVSQQKLAETITRSGYKIRLRD